MTFFQNTFCRMPADDRFSCTSKQLSVLSALFLPKKSLSAQKNCTAGPAHCDAIT